MASDSSKDKTEVFLSGVVEGNKRSFDEKHIEFPYLRMSPPKLVYHKGVHFMKIK